MILFDHNLLPVKRTKKYRMKTLIDLKKEIQIQNKNGIDFVLAAGVLWLVLTYIWTLDFSSYNKSIFSFMVSALLLPLAFVLSKVLKTQWKAKDNPLQPLGLWINFAQLIYFPLLIFVLLNTPDYFIMAYAVITGAHFFPYAWFYDEMGYAIWAVLISVGAFLVSLIADIEYIWTVPLFTAMMLFLLAIKILLRFTLLRGSTLQRNA